MRIGIDGVSVSTGGGVTYFANLLPTLAPILEARGDMLFVYTREGGRVSVPASPSVSERHVAPASISASRRVLWAQATYPRHARHDRLDVFYGPADSVPLALHCPTVCAFRNPNTYADIMASPPRKRLRLTGLRMLAMASARECRRAIFVSAAARDDILPVLNLDPAKARVVHHGMGEFFKSALSNAALASQSPWPRPYLLMVSTLYHYKNCVRLIEAFDKYVHKAGLPHGLALVGAQVETWAAQPIKETIRRLGLEQHVLLAGEIRYPDVAAWYRHASAFVFPSYRETFGHPLLESMAADLPLAASDIPVMREIAGDVARYFDPFSVDSIGEALVDVLDVSKREERIKRGRERLKQFTWDRTARLTLEVIQEAAGASG